MRTMVKDVTDLAVNDQAAMSTKELGLEKGSSENERLGNMSRGRRDDRTNANAAKDAFWRNKSRWPCTDAVEQSVEARLRKWSGGG